MGVVPTSNMSGLNCYIAALLVAAATGTSLSAPTGQYCAGVPFILEMKVDLTSESVMNFDLNIKVAHKEIKCPTEAIATSASEITFPNILKTGDCLGDRLRVLKKDVSKFVMEINADGTLSFKSGGAWPSLKLKPCSVIELKKTTVTPTQNIVELASGIADLSTLVTALKAGKLVTALSGKGPFTVFAPTNEAFAALPTGTLAQLLDPMNIKALQSILEYHVIARAAIHANDLKASQDVKTLEGQKLHITMVDGSVTVQKAKVTQADVAATNGVVHVINGVLTPAPLFCMHQEDTVDHKCFEACAPTKFDMKGITGASRCPSKYNTLDKTQVIRQCPDGLTSLRYCADTALNVTIQTKGERYEMMAVTELAEAQTTLYILTKGGCNQATLDSKYAEYAIKFAHLSEGTCAAQGYTVADGTQTIKVPVLGDITIAKFKKALTVTLLKEVEPLAPTEKCCTDCVAPQVKYFSVDVPHGFCGETCIRPRSYGLFHLFEKNLTRATDNTPCREQFTPNGGHYTKYTSTVSHGGFGLKVTLDLYGPAPEGSQPTGSYESSCSACKWADDTLTCDCQNGEGDLHKSTLPHYSACLAKGDDIDNVDGSLICNKKG